MHPFQCGVYSFICCCFSFLTLFFAFAFYHDASAGRPTCMCFNAFRSFTYHTSNIVVKQVNRNAVTFSLHTFDAQATNQECRLVQRIAMLAKECGQERHVSDIVQQRGKLTMKQLAFIFRMELCCVFYFYFYSSSMFHTKRECQNECETIASTITMTTAKMMMPKQNILTHCAQIAFNEAENVCTIFESIDLSKAIYRHLVTLSNS